MILIRYLVYKFTQWSIGYLDQQLPQQQNSTLYKNIALYSLLSIFSYFQFYSQPRNSSVLQLRRYSQALGLRDILAQAGEAWSFSCTVAYQYILDVISFIDVIDSYFIQKTCVVGSLITYLCRVVMLSSKKASRIEILFLWMIV